MLGAPHGSRVGCIGRFGAFTAHSSVPAEDRTAYRLPEGVTVQKRAGGGKTFLFLHNFATEERVLELGATRLVDMTDDTTLTGRVTLPAYASRVVEKR